MFTLETFYKSREWQNLRESLMLARQNENGDLLCEYCGKPIVRKYDCIGHHETELTADNVNDYSISLNPANVKLIHFKCHNLIHQRFGGFSQSVYLVYGAPCSGKTTWVRENANADDLIIDIDAIWESISTSDKYHKPNRLKANVFGLRDCLIDQVRTRTGMWRAAYLIGGYPLRSDRDRLCDMLNATPVYIETTKEECLSRAQSSEWKEFIENWFDSYTE